MNQMGHEIPNMIGVKPEGLDEKLRPLLPAYMTMGQDGMDMGAWRTHADAEEHHPDDGQSRPVRRRSSMGGMFTLLKVRDRLKELRRRSGWYEHPPGTVAMKASEQELKRDGIELTTGNNVR